MEILNDGLAECGLVAMSLNVEACQGSVGGELCAVGLRRRRSQEEPRSVFVETMIAKWQSVVIARKIRMKADGVLAIKHSDRVGHGLHGFSSLV